MNGKKIENMKITKHRKNSSFFQSAQMMVATECWLVHTNTVGTRMAGSMTPSAKNTVHRMMRKLKAKLRSVEGGGGFLAGGGGACAGGRGAAAGPAGPRHAGAHGLNNNGSVHT